MSTKISFADWVDELEKAGRTKADIAAYIGTELASLYRYLANDRIPNRQVMARIVELSEGRVEVAWFYVTKPPQAEPAPVQV
jgi:hypothetical protein